MGLFRLFSEGETVYQESLVPCKPERKKETITKPVKMNSIHIYNWEIKIKGIEETNKEMNKGHEPFT